MDTGDWASVEDGHRDPSLECREDLGVRKGAWRGGPDRLTGIDPEEGSTRSGWVENLGVAWEEPPQKIFK